MGLYWGCCENTRIKMLPKQLLDLVWWLETGCRYLHHQSAKSMVLGMQNREWSDFGQDI